MKKFFTLVVLALLAVGCAKEYDDTGLRELIAGLDVRVSELEANVSALQSTLGDGKFVRKVEEYRDPDTGSTTGVTVTYTDGNIVHFNIVPSDPSQGPVFSVIRNGAGELVWAVDGQAIKVDGAEVPVYQTPSFSIDDEGNLWVEVDGQRTNLGPVKSEGATLQDGIFTNLAVTDDAVVLTLSDGSTVNIPFAEAFVLNIETTEFSFSTLDPIEIPYTVSAKTEGTVVGVAGYSPKEFNVAVEADKIVVTPLSKNAAAVMMAYADSKVGLVSVVNLTFEAEGFEITDEPYSAEYDYIAEGEGAVVVANAVSNIAFEVKPVEEWIHVASVRSQAYVITLRLDDNKTGEIRVGTVNIVKAGTEEVIQTIKIAQLPAEIVSGPADLSKKESANSYLVYAAGDYKFKAVKGVSGASVGTIAEVAVVWETNNTTTAPEAGSIIAKVEVADGYIFFSTPETLTPGNALIAAKDAAGEILWSWHIWIPASEIKTADAGFAGAKALMDRNLGALEPAPVTGKLLESEGLLYQWGRKDPLLGKKITAVPAEAVGQSVDSAPTDMATATKTPTVFYYNEGKDWLTTPDANLWDNAGAKTENDPCPPGYKVPAYDPSLDLWNKLDDFPSKWTYDETAGYTKFTAGTVTFPLCGYLNGGGQSTSGYGKRSLVWSSTAKNETHGSGLFVRENKYYSDGNHKACGASVRCIVVDEGAINPPTPTPGPGPEPEVPATDLSETASANSYIVTKAGDFKFKAVKGNSEEAVSAASIEVLWETVNTTTAPEAGTVIANAAFADGYVTFSTPATLVPGNALIAAKDGAGVILWSWHIWIPATPVVASTFGGVVGVPMMDRNLGALVAAEPTGKPDGTSIGMLYQWGRKDPFPGTASVDASDPIATTGTIVLDSEKQNFSIEESVQNPTTYVKTGSDSNKTWIDEPSIELWGKTKTVYDPCPPGYIVSTRDKTWAFWGGMASATGFRADTENKFVALGVDLDPASPETTGYIVLPMCGYLDQGSYANVGKRAYIWSSYSSSSEKNIAYQIYINSGDVSTTEQRMSRGGNIRCVVEE